MFTYALYTVCMYTKHSIMYIYILYTGTVYMPYIIFVPVECIYVLCSLIPCHFRAQCFVPHVFALQWLCLLVYVFFSWCLFLFLFYFFMVFFLCCDVFLFVCFVLFLYLSYLSCFPSYPRSQGVIPHSQP